MTLQWWLRRNEIPLGLFVALLFGLVVAGAEPIPWCEISGETLLRDAQLLVLVPAGAYALGWTSDGEIQANDLVRGGVAWKKAGREFAVHAGSGRIAIRQASGFIRFYAAETGRFLFERDPADADLSFREEGSVVPVVLALSAGMIPADKGKYEGEALLSRGIASARLRSGEVVVAEQSTGRELLRVLPFASGNSFCVCPDGTWGGSESLRGVMESSTSGRRGLTVWDGELYHRIFGNPGTAPPGVEVPTGPWKVLTRETREGQLSELEWSFWLQASSSGRITGRGNLVGTNGSWASGKDRGTWSGLSLQLERTEARGASEEKMDGEILRKPEWHVHFHDDGRSFQGVAEGIGDAEEIAIEGRFAGESQPPGGK